MPKVRVYEYEKCQTCRNALKWLDSKGIPYEKVPIVERPPALAELRAMAARAGGVRKLFNTSGLLYKEMGLGAKLPTMKEAEAFALLARHGKLVKRPFLVGGKGGLVGFKQPEWEAFFG